MKSRTAINRQFWPSSYNDVKAVANPIHPLNAAYRQTSSVLGDGVRHGLPHGIVNGDYWAEFNGEGLLLFAKVAPFIDEIRRDPSLMAFTNAQWLASEARNRTAAVRHDAEARRRGCCRTIAGFRRGRGCGVENIPGTWHVRSPSRPPPLPGRRQRRFPPISRLTSCASCTARCCCRGSSRRRCSCCCGRAGCRSGSPASGRRRSRSAWRPRSQTDDWILPHAPQPGRLHGAAGSTCGRLFRQLFGKDGGFTRGPRPHLPLRHCSSKRIVGMISHLGAMLPVADGLALAAQLRGEKRVAAAFTGDGATSEGDFHEALNLAAVWKLPVLFVIENNQYGLSTPVSEQYACRDLADRGVGLRHARRTSWTATTCWPCSRGARARPSARAPRRRADAARVQDLPHARPRGGLGHRLRAEAAVRGVGGEGPGRAASSSACSTTGVLTADDARRDARRSSRRESTRSWTRPSRRPIRSRRPSASWPTSTRRAGAAPQQPAPRRRGGAGAALRRRDQRWPARGHARATRRSCCSGQDIAEYGGVFKVTEGFVAGVRQGARAQHADHRVGRDRRGAWAWRSTASGPMVEMQFGDFITCGFNQIVNNLAKTHYRWGAAVPVVLRVPDRRRHGRRAVPLAERRGVVHARRRAQGGGAGDAVRRQGPAAGRVRGRQPGALPRAQAAVPLGEGAGAGGLLHACRSAGRASRARAATPPSSPTASASRGRSRRRRALAARGPRGRGRRPALAAALGPRDGARVGAGRPAARWCCTRRRSPAASAARSPRPSASEAFEWLDAPVVRARRARHADPVQQGALEEIFSGAGRLLPALEALLAY